MKPSLATVSTEHLIENLSERADCTAALTTWGGLALVPGPCHFCLAMHEERGGPGTFFHVHDVKGVER